MGSEGVLLTLQTVEWLYWSRLIHLLPREPVLLISHLLSLACLSRFLLQILLEQRCFDD